jgi:diadenosine tetraphosphate (Ap4A) HIT family hydrolase
MTSTNPGHEPGCGICRSLSGPDAQRPLYEDELWHVRHLGAPHGLPGWMMLIAKRHVAGPAHFTDVEAANFGPVLRHLEKKLEEVTGALRIYTAALGESSPHFHCHMLPRYAKMPNDVKAWGAFDLERAARAGEITVDLAEVARLSEAYRAVLAESPPPRGR